MTSRAEIINDILSEVRERRVDVARSWKATWLLTPITATKWLIRKKGTTWVDGKWEHALAINWTDRLPDGSSLDDPKNQVYLEMVQKLAFLIREEACDIRSSFTFMSYVSVIKALTQWVFCNSRKFKPATAGLSLVDEKAALLFAKTYISGGLFDVGNYAGRFLKQIAPDAYVRWKSDSESEQNYFRLPLYLVAEVTTWLSDNDFYRTTRGRGPTRGLRYIDRNKLCELLKTSPSMSWTDKFSCSYRWLRLRASISNLPEGG